MCDEHQLAAMGAPGGVARMDRRQFAGAGALAALAAVGPTVSARVSGHWSPGY